MNRFHKGRVLTAMVLVAAMVVPSVTCNTANAAAKAKLTKKKVSIEVGSTYLLKAKNVKSVKWSINKSKIAKLSAKKKLSVKISGKVAGSAIVTAKFKLAGKSKKLTCKVNVVKKKITEATQTPFIATASPKPVVTASAAPTAMTATATPVVPTAVPTPTVVPTAVPTASVQATSGSWAYIPVDDDSLLKEYESIFGNVGTCLTYDVFKTEMQDAKTMAFVRKNFNSYTLENEMKPSYFLADAEKSFFEPPLNKVISVQDAKNAGYFIPVDYAEANVPTINYDRIDKILKIAADNGIRMRAHTLVWHNNQTPTAFLRQDYNETGNFATPEIMNQRLIYYITNVMNHICESEYSSVVYAWDVVNEYFHQLSDGSARSYSNVYKLEESGSLTTKPEYVKIAFKAAYDVLAAHDMVGKVQLFYNDYNTSQVADNIVSMVNYINAKDDINPEGNKLCGGIGMQCHLDVKWPSVQEQLGTVKKFIDAGYEVQITELDIGNSNNASEEAYCEYWYQFMKGLVDLRLQGGNITGVTFWGLSNSVSWKRGDYALLYGKDINDPLKALYAAYAAAQTKWDIKD